MFFVCLLGLLCFAASIGHAEDTKRAPVGSVQISFLPPPLEKATYSLGIFDAKTNKLVRQLTVAALEKDFTVGLNGLITTWDGKDDSGKAAPPGRYAAHGYAIGPLKIEGEDTLSNDWTSANEALRIIRIELIAYVPQDGGLIILAKTTDGERKLIRFSGSKDSRSLWQASVKRDEFMGLDAQSLSVDAEWVYLMPHITPTTMDSVQIFRAYRLSDGKEEHVVRASPTADNSSSSSKTPIAPPFDHEARSRGKDGTKWFARAKDGITQESLDGSILRHLDVKPDEPLPTSVSASSDGNRLYLLEEKTGWQRVRGLAWLETKEEEGHSVSTWQTFFERNIHAAESGNLGENQELRAMRDISIEINLDENPLTPAKQQKVYLAATWDQSGSYLSTKNNLKLRQVSDRSHLVYSYLAKGSSPTVVEFFQYDGAATDEFSIKGINHIMAFDAGEFELTADGGEKPAPKPTEPPDL